MLKIDLAKAFDSVEWPFVINALQHKGYHGHFIRLIHACISSVFFAINFSGKSYGQFCAIKGIKQGCPLLLYLFVIAIDELSVRL